VVTETNVRFRDLILERDFPETPQDFELGIRLWKIQIFVKANRFGNCGINQLVKGIVPDLVKHLAQLFLAGTHMPLDERRK
jgi:hypothetical protein